MEPDNHFTFPNMLVLSYWWREL